MKKWLTLLLSAALSGVLFLSVANAASPLRVDGLYPILKNEIQVSLNNKLIPLPEGAEVIVHKGTTLVPLNIIRNLGHQVTWDNNSKTAIVQYKNSKITLKLGAKIATINEKKVELAQPVMLRNQYVLVPLRIIIDASGAEVVYNQSDKVVYIAAPSPQQLADLTSESLGKARLAALALPLIDPLQEFEAAAQGERSIVFFPEGQADRFMTIQDGVLSYYQVNKGIKYKQGSAFVNEVAPGSPGETILPNIPYSLKYNSFIGKRPPLTGTLVYFRALPSGGIEYGYARGSGLEKVGGTVAADLALPGEQRAY